MGPSTEGHVSHPSHFPILPPPFFLVLHWENGHLFYLLKQSFSQFSIGYIKEGWAQTVVFSMNYMKEGWERRHNNLTSCRVFIFSTLDIELVPKTFVGRERERGRSYSIHSSKDSHIWFPSKLQWTIGNYSSRLIFDKSSSTSWWYWSHPARKSVI